MGMFSQWTLMRTCSNLGARCHNDDQFYIKLAGGCTTSCLVKHDSRCFYNTVFGCDLRWNWWISRKTDGLPDGGGPPLISWKPEQNKDWQEGGQQQASPCTAAAPPPGSSAGSPSCRCWVAGLHDHVSQSPKLNLSLWTHTSRSVLTLWRTAHLQTHLGSQGLTAVTGSGRGLVRKEGRLSGLRAPYKAEVGLSQCLVFP